MALFFSKQVNAVGFALGLVIFRLALVKNRLVPARINHEQHVAFFHQLAGLKTHFLDVTGNARADFHRIHRLGMPGEFTPFDNVLLLHRRHRHLRRRRLLLGHAFAATRQCHHRPRGDFAMANIPQTLNVYISSKRQYFSRRGASTRAGSGSFDAVGTNGQSHEGNARGVTFSGHAMNVSAALSSGARSVSVQFDGGYGSCDANVIVGRNGGQNIKIKALVGGQTVEIKSATASGASLSIREGNVLQIKQTDHTPT